MGSIYLIYAHRQSIFIKLQLLWLFIPLFLLLFFVGNYGTLYDYYLTGFYPAFIILMAVLITLHKLKIFYLLFFAYFINGTYLPLKNYLIAGIDGQETITYGNELSAVDYVCQQNSINPGNYDVYVPPVIAHSYDYLFRWRQSKHQCNSFIADRNNNLYIIYEVDPPHPERLSNWFDKYKQDKILHEEYFGGVRVRQLLRVSK
jgi:hypothetical protein